MATRELYWNIAGHVFMYAFVVVFIAIFAYGVYRRYRMWRVGRPDERFRDFWRWRTLWQRKKTVLVDGLAQVRFFRDAYPGIMHFAMFWGFIVLFAGTVVVAGQADLGIRMLFGTFYLIFSITLDLFGVLAIIGILMAIWRRYVTRPSRLDNNWDDAVILWGLLAVLITGYLLQGLRIAATNDPWVAWEPVGNLVARLMLAAGATIGGMELWHRIFWWFHMFAGAGFVAYLPYSKLFHMFASPANQFLRTLGPAGVLSKVDIENSESFGVSKVEEFTWKQLFETDACTRCGRCQDYCPANLSGKHLSPKALIQDLKTHLWEVGPALVRRPQTGAAAEAAATATKATPCKAMVGEVFKDDDIWACTTCRACDEQCPVYVEHVDMIVDMRRYLALMEMRFPPEVDRAFRNIQNQSNPWGLGAGYRADWAADLGVKKLSDGEPVDVLYWVGCAGAYDDRNKKVATAFVKVLQAAGVNFGILGTEEKCCGDTARRLGNEYLFQMLAQENVEVIKGHGVKKVVTTCPHCFNTLKNEYPQFGADFEVVHHSEFIAQLLAQGKLDLNGQGGQAADGPGAADGQGKLSGTVTYHDSCYLGRYNDVYAQPREIVKGALADGGKFVEMDRNHGKSFCCGAGGGRMWLEESHGKRINEMRVDQAVETKAETVVTACPFCMTMFTDGVKAKELTEKVKLMDLAEVVAGRLKAE